MNELDKVPGLAKAISDATRAFEQLRGLNDLAAAVKRANELSDDIRKVADQLKSVIPDYEKISPLASASVSATLGATVAKYLAEANNLSTNYTRLHANLRTLADIQKGIRETSIESESFKLAGLAKQATEAVEALTSVANVEAAKVALLGKKGSFNEQLKSIGKLPQSERKAVASILNEQTTALEQVIENKKQKLEDAALDERLATEKVDVTLPIAPLPKGRIHPVTQAMEEIVAIFSAMGFDVAEGPDIEDDFHNFTALNFPADHPAREMHDTFFFNEKQGGSRMLLRTHTSPVQIRTMMTRKPPIRIIIPGRTFRCDSDQTHTPMFHQVEGLVIDRETHMGHLKGTLEAFCKAYFEVDSVKTRFRPHFFPFTEPSAEMDIGYERVGNEIRIGQGAKWMEILGSGMVHPNVLRNCGLDPDEYQGFAFGMGIDRLAMLKYGIPDLRDFFAADARWLEHYGFDPLDQPNLATGLSR